MNRPETRDQRPETEGDGLERQSQAALIEVQGLTREFKSGAGVVRVLRGVDLTVRRGEAVVITGPSGSGKSTLLHCIGALLKPTSGRVLVGGQDPWTWSDRERSELRARRVGFIFQAHELLPDLTVLENCMLAGRIAGMRSVKKAAKDLLDGLGLGDCLYKYPSQISGGESQRVAIARALVKGPELLLCDEPTGNLDPENAQQVLNLMSGLKREAGHGLIVVTHNPELVRIADRVYRLENGVLSN
ncbi:MAG: ABC transporter ATP-binding protein [Candidatus Omnitrophica bacterium]|nr:ABC transporter ATP-binding protein [Candidatus Omnitrophota bacterium]